MHFIFSRFVHLRATSSPRAPVTRFFVRSNPQPRTSRLAGTPLPSPGNMAAPPADALDSARDHGRTRHQAMIIGSGPAGNTAAIYLARANLEPVLFEGPRLPTVFDLGEDGRHDAPSHQSTPDIPRAGGELATSSAVGNFPGFPDGIAGQAIVDKFRAQALRFGTTIISERIAKVDLSSRPFRVWRDRRDPFEVALGANPSAPPETVAEDEYELTDTLIYATGASAKRLHLPGEELYWQSGISTCAVCDGAAPIFRGKTLVVVGGGSSACEEALHLTRYAKKVIVLVRKAQMRASPVLFKRVVANPAIDIRYRTEAVEAKGDEDLLQAVRIRNNETGDEVDVPASGLFYAVGHAPATYLVRGQVDCDQDGYILTTPGSTRTSVKGFYAAGDVQDRKYRQAITSAGSGCMAALEAERLISEDHHLYGNLSIEELQASKGYQGRPIP